MSGESMNQTLWRWIGTSLILIPALALALHYGVEQKRVQSCQKQQGSYNYVAKKCDLHVRHPVKPYQEREWRRVVISEILIIAGFFLKLYLRHRGQRRLLRTPR